MKKVLSLLVIFVFLNVQSWALSGGPIFTRSAKSVTGTYSGVLVPIVVPVAAAVPAVPAAVPAQAATIGVFAFGIPNTEAATINGSAVIFYNGLPYNSTVIGVYDPGENKLTAIVEGTAMYSTTTSTSSSGQTTGGIIGLTGTTASTSTSTTSTNFYAQGSLTGSLEDSSDASNGVRAVANTASAERVKGTATVDIYATVDTTTGIPNVTNTLSFSVDGFQQSSVYTAPIITVVGGANAAGSTTTGS